MKSPFCVALVVRGPCSAGEVAVTTAAVTGRPELSTTRPEIVPVGFCAADGAASSVINEQSNTTLKKDCTRVNISAFLLTSRGRQSYPGLERMSVCER